MVAVRSIGERLPQLTYRSQGRLQLHRPARLRECSAAKGVWLDRFIGRPLESSKSSSSDASTIAVDGWVRAMLAARPAADSRRGRAAPESIRAVGAAAGRGGGRAPAPRHFQVGDQPVVVADFSDGPAL